MKLLGKTALSMMPALLALLFGTALRGYASQIAVGSDSLIMRTAVGASTISDVTVRVTGDTTAGINQQTVHVSLTGGSEFTLASDSILQFIGAGNISIRYAPTSSSTTDAVLTLVGDSNTVYVTIVGEPLTHLGPNILIGSYYNVPVNQQTCNSFEVYNTNTSSISVTNVILTQPSGTGWSLDNLVTLPVTVASHGTDTLGQLCVLPLRADTSFSGSLTIIYSYGTGTDSTSIDLQGYHRALNSVCVHTSGGDFGAIAEGASVIRTITLTNVTDTSIYLDSAQVAYGDYSQFAINSPSFPVTLEPDSSVNVSITFTAPSPSATDNYYASFLCAVHGPSPDDVPCNSVGIQLSASVAIPVVDSITLDVPPGANTLSITAHTDKSRHAIFIHNSGTNRLLLESLSISSADTGLAFFGQAGTLTANIYDSLDAGATSGSVLLTLEAPDTGTYSIDLTLTYVIQQAHQKGATPASNSSLTYSVVAHRLPAASAGVSEPQPPQPAQFTLSPNPARDEVTIGLSNDGVSNVEIYDVLGNLVFQETELGSFVWDGTRSGSLASNAVYIVRVRHGNRVSSQRLVFVR